MNDIIIDDPALWRAGDKVTIEGTLVEERLAGASITLGEFGPLVRYGSASLSASFRDETTTVTVRRPVQPIPDHVGDIFYATVNGEPDTQVTVLAPDYFCGIYAGSHGYYEADDIDASTVRRVRLVPEDEQ